MPELSVIRGLKPDQVADSVHNRNIWRAQNRYGWRQTEISQELTDRLQKLCYELHKVKDHIKFVISYDTGYVYTNDQQIVQDIAKFKFIRHIESKEIVKVAPTGTVQLKNPKWAYRTYFRSKTLDDKQRTSLVEFLNSRENVRLSPGLVYWVNEGNRPHRSYWLQDYFFIDHNDSGDILFLNMIIPRITNRTLNIVAK